MIQTEELMDHPQNCGQPSCDGIGDFVEITLQVIVFSDSRFVQYPLSDNGACPLGLAWTNNAL